MPIASKTQESHSLIFHGKGSSFFIICLVNVILSVITCGIFLPWAIVRCRRYIFWKYGAAWCPIWLPCERQRYIYKLDCHNSHNGSSHFYRIRIDSLWDYCLCTLDTYPDASLNDGEKSGLSRSNDLFEQCALWLSVLHATCMVDFNWHACSGLSIDVYCFYRSHAATMAIRPRTNGFVNSLPDRTVRNSHIHT